MQKAAGYVRISQDRESEERGVSRQTEDLEAFAKREGIELVEVFTDNDLGASSRSKKPRPAYNAMIQGVKDGRFDTILAYSNSRLTRRMLDLEALIQLHEQTGVVIRTIVSGNDDLATADGRMIARIKASVDGAEAERTGERVKRAHLQNARDGKAVGHRAFGWKEDKTTIDRKVQETLLPVMESVIDGTPLAHAAARLNELGLTTASGKDWTTRLLKQYLTNPRLVGHRTYQRKVMFDGLGKPVRGAWEPMVDQETWDKLQTVLDRPDGRRSVSRPGTRKFLLTGLVRCGVCRGQMYAQHYRNKKNGHYYMCRNVTSGPNRHSVSVSGRSLENTIKGLVLARSAQTIQEVTEPKERKWSRMAEKVELEETIEGLYAHTRKSASRERAFAQLEVVEEELAVLEREYQGWLAEAPLVLTNTTTPDEWENGDLHQRQGFIRDLIVAVYVMPPKKRTGSRFDAERLSLAWR